MEWWGYVLIGVSVVAFGFILSALFANRGRISDREEQEFYKFMHDYKAKHPDKYRCKNEEVRQDEASDREDNTAE